MKNLNKKISLIGGLMIFAILFSAVSVQAQQRQNFKKMRMEKNVERRVGQGQQYGFICDNLNLSDTQKEAIEKLRMNNQKISLQHRNLVNEKRARLQTLKSADNFDQKAINKVIDEMTEMKAEHMKESIAHQREVRNLLTEEQQLIFDVQKQNGMNKQRANRGQRMGQKRMHRSRF